MSWILSYRVVGMWMYGSWDQDRLLWTFGKQSATRFGTKEEALGALVASTLVKGREEEFDIEATEIDA